MGFLRRDGERRRRITPFSVLPASAPAGAARGRRRG